MATLETAQQGPGGKRSFAVGNSAKLMTFESWVTREAWYRYARSAPQDVPHLLVDRSPCCDPFFDPFAGKASERVPTISGLCRCWKGFQVGLRVVYVTRLDRRVAEEIGRPIATMNPVYLLV